MGMLKEFREFAVRGNAVDMAVGIIIGAAFGQIVNSLVNDVILLPIGMLSKHMDFSKLAVQLNDKPILRYGAFLNTVINFLIVAFCVFLVVRVMNRILKTSSKEPTEKTCPECLSKIPMKAKRCAHCTSQVE